MQQTMGMFAYNNEYRFVKYFTIKILNKALDIAKVPIFCLFDLSFKSMCLYFVRLICRLLLLLLNHPHSHSAHYAHYVRKNLCTKRKIFSSSIIVVGL